MVGIAELRQLVDEVYRRDAAHLPAWPDPHQDRSPTDDEYSRVLDPAKWRIVTARADAWASALVELGMADVERHSDVEWEAPRNADMTRTDRVVPRSGAGTPLLLGHRGFEGLDDNAVAVGVGEPAVEVDSAPHCGCDACDHGSDGALDIVDAAVHDVLTGSFRRLVNSDGDLIFRGDGWSSSGDFDSDALRLSVESTDELPGWDQMTTVAWFPQ